VDVRGEVTIHRYYASGTGTGTGTGTGRGGADGQFECEWRATSCLSEVAYLLCFTALFLLFFGTPGVTSLKP
jgi:hypothetical protein